MYATMAGDARLGFGVCDTIVSAQPLVRARRSALLDARHRRDLGDLQRPSRRAYRAYPYAKAGEIWAPDVRARDSCGGHGYTLDELRCFTDDPPFAE